MLNLENLIRRYLEIGEKEDICFAEKLYMANHIKCMETYSNLENTNRNDDLEILFNIAWNYWLELDYELDYIEHTMFDYIYIIFDEDKTRVEEILKIYKNSGLEKTYEFLDTLF